MEDLLKTIEVACKAARESLRNGDGEEVATSVFFEAAVQMYKHLKGWE